jgi:hypothetical protein
MKNANFNNLKIFIHVFLCNIFALTYCLEIFNKHSKIVDKAHDDTTSTIIFSPPFGFPMITRP